MGQVVSFGAASAAGSSSGGAGGSGGSNCDALVPLPPVVNFGGTDWPADSAYREGACAAAAGHGNWICTHRRYTVERLRWEAGYQHQRAGLLEGFDITPHRNAATVSAATSAGAASAA